MANLTLLQLNQEFDRQVNNLMDKKYHEFTDITQAEFLSLVNPLRNKLSELTLPEVNIEEGTLPFVIVVKSSLIDSETAMSLVNKNGKQGITILRPHTSKDFKTIEKVTIPASRIYLLIGINRGKDTINMPPSEAIEHIYSKNSTPLTIDEGIAIITHFPEFLKKNNCFSLLASRTGKDQRVPAIWINSNKQPNLGWCWDGNPHTWLGSASAKDRVE